MLRLRRERESRRQDEGAAAEAVAQDAPSPAGTPPDVGAGARADAFVSYARRDEPFVRSVLVEALAGRGKEVWLDVKDIPPAADWRDRIRAGIEAARAFVFVISPDSAASRPCLDELRQAVELNKPLIVVVREDVPRERLSSALEPVEWIFMRESDALEDGIEEVVAALEMDLEWRDLHNELAVRAREWEREGRDGALLLRGRALAEAEQWQADPGPHRESPTPEQTAYIQAGRHAAGRRTRMLVGSVTTALVVSLALAAYAFVQRGQAVSRERTATSLALAAASSRELGGNLGSSLVLGLEAMHARVTPNARNAMISALEKARRNGLETVLCCHRGALDSLAFSPDGKTAAAGADDGTLLLWDLTSRRLLARIEQAHETAVRSVAFSPDGERLASGSAESVRLWDARTGRALGRLGGSKGGGADALAFSPDGHTLAGGRGGVMLWDTRSPGREGRWTGGVGGVTHAVAFSPDGASVAFDSYLQAGKYSQGGVIVVHVDPKDHRPLPDSTGGEPTALALRGDRLEAAFPDGTVYLGPGGSGHTLSIGHAISSAAFAPGGRYLAVGASDGTTEVWDVRRRKQVSVLRGHNGPVESVAFATDRIVAAAGVDGTVTLRTIGRRKPFGLPLSRRTGITDKGFDPQIGVDAPDVFAFSRDGDGVASVDGSHVVIRNASTGEPTQTIPARAAALEFGRDGHTLVLAGARSSIWDTRGPRQIASLAPGGTSAVVTRDGTVVTGGYDGITVRDPQGHDLAVPGSRGASCIAVSPDGRTLAAAGGSTIVLWDMKQLDRTPQVVRDGQLDCLAFSPDGRLLATAGSDGTVRLWNTRTRQQRDAPLFRYAGKATKASVHPETSVINELGPVGGVAFSPDGSMLASVHADGTLRLWDVGTGGQLGKTLSGRDGALEGVGFSPDGRALATSAVNGVVRLWQGLLWSDFSDLRSQVCGLVVGSLSRADWNRFAPGLAYRSTCGS